MELRHFYVTVQRRSVDKPGCGRPLSVACDGFGNNVYETHGAPLCELIKHLPATGYAANSVTMLVTVALDHLRDQLGSAGLDTGRSRGARSTTAPWSRGGKTDLADAVPLCGFHHHKAHDDRFTLQRQEHRGWRLRPRR